MANDNPPPWNATGLTNAGFNTSATAIQYHDQTGQWLVDVTGGPATRYIKTEANGAGSVVLGVQSKATGALATAIGTGSRAEAFASTAFGIGSKATKENSVALGAGATTVTDAEAIDDATVGTGADAVTYSGFAGDDNVIAGDQVSVGAAGYERQIKHVAPGAITETSTDAINGSQLFVITKDIQDNIKESTQTYFHFNDPNMTQGVGDVANNLGGVTDTAGAEGDYSVTAGFGAGATGEGGIAIGYKATSTGDYAVVIGGDGGDGTNTASADYAVSMGNGTTASGTSSTAMGHKTIAAGNDSFAVGNAAEAYGSSSVALGWDTEARGKDAVAMGTQSKAVGDSSTAMGDSSEAVGRNSLATQGGKAKTESSIAIGLGTVAGTDGGTEEAAAIGYRAEATANQSLALGFDAIASHENSVALGQGAVTKDDVQVTTATVGDLTYSGFAGTANGVVSVGAAGAEKQIVNVAPGEISANSTDAINGSQLHATNTVLDNLANSVQNNFGGNAALNADGNITFTDIGGTGESNIHDAIQSINTTANAGFTIAGASPTTAADAQIKPNETLNIVGDAANTDFTQSDAGKNIYTVVDADNTVRIGLANDLDVTSVTAETVNATTSVTIGDATDPANSTTLTSGPNGLDVGGDQITNVAEGEISATSTDAINGSQLFDLGSSTAAALGGTSTFDPTTGTVTAGLSVGGNNYTNVQDALTSLNATASAHNTTTAGTNIDVVETTNADGSTNYEIKTKDQVEFQQVTIGDVANNTVLTSTADGLDVGGDNITNVAAAALNPTSTDAVNGSQLYATNLNVTNNATNIAKGINFGGTTGYNNYALGDTINVKGDSNITSTTVAGGVQLGLADEVTIGTGNPVTINGTAGTINGLTNTTFDPNNFTSGQAATEDQLASVTQTANAGWNITANGKDSSNVGPGSTVDFNNSDGNILIKKDGNNLTFDLNPNLHVDSVTTGDTQINSNGLFIKNGPSVSKSGIDAAGRQITNVAPGTRPTDAVNLSQLDDVDDNGSRGTASALAAAALPQAYTAGSNMITAGAGTYRGHNAVAIGYSSMSDNGKWLFKGSASLNKEDAGFSVGMGYMW